MISTIINAILTLCLYTCKIFQISKMTPSCGISFISAMLLVSDHRIANEGTIMNIWDQWINPHKHKTRHNIKTLSPRKQNLYVFMENKNI